MAARGARPRHPRRGEELSAPALGGHGRPAFSVEAAPQALPATGTVDSLQLRFVGLAFGGAGPDDAELREAGAVHPPDADVVAALAVPVEPERRLAARHGQVHLGQQARVQQGAVQFALQESPRMYVGFRRLGLFID